ncbi:MAG: hypothetical protein ACI9DG_000686 [Oleispira sp.]|jgi:hypothetical protein
MSLLKQIRLLFIDFFNRLGQIQSPDGDITMTCPLRRLPKMVTIKNTQCPENQVSNKS